MRRLLGLSLVALGLLPLVGLFAVYWIWAQHMYTVGLSADAKGVTMLVAVAVLDLSLLFAGVYLLRTRRTPN